MRLSAFILEKMEPILREWEDVAQGIQPSCRRMDVAGYRGHAQEILAEIAAALRASEAADGDDARPAHAARTQESPAETRLKPGFNVDHLVCAYRALRVGVLNLWSRRDKSATRVEPDDMRRFNELLDRALAESIARYSALARRSQGIFLGLVGHDLRTPLQCLSIGAQFLMMSEKHDPQLIQLGSRMYDSAARMGQILDNLLDFTRSRIGNGMQIKPRQVDLAAIAGQVADEFRFANPGRVIHTEVCGDVCGHLDGARIGQVYQNLIGNALQHGTKDKDVTVRTCGDANGIRIEVHNHGDPIPAAEQDSIFDPLHRCANWSDERQEQLNLGLGLYIVREIVTAHKGSIKVQSGTGIGTTFLVWLPKSRDEERNQK